MTQTQQHRDSEQDGRRDDIVLGVHDLDVTFHADTDIHAVEHLSFDVHRDEILAVVGESGSGKSVTVQAILGLLPYYAQVHGTLSVGDGRELDLGDAAALRPLRGRYASMVFQDPYASLDPVFTIGDQIAEAVTAMDGSLDKTAVHDRVRELLADVRLDGVEHIERKYPHELSGGQLQRVMMAIALAGRPTILLADEPTTALDATVQQEVLDLLHDIAANLGISVLIITHDMGVVADLADRVLVMHNGRFVEQGDVDAVFAHPVEDYTKKLLAAVPSNAKPAVRAGAGGDAASGDGAGAGASDAASAAKPMLSVKDLTVSYRSRGGAVKEVVHGVSFDIEPREIVALVGQSGSGKSTIARSLLGLNPLTGGTVLIDGQDVSALGRKERRQVQSHIGIVFQSPSGSLNPRLTIGEIIAEPLRFVLHMNRKDALARAGELLETVQLPAALVDRYPSELSGGQRQRVAIARAIAAKPTLLIADEPTSALDVSVQSEILALLNRLQHDIGFACLFISHDLPLVRSFSHRTIVLRDGVMVESGITEELFAHPTQEYTRELILSAPVADPQVQHERRRERLGRTEQAH
ncbi:glutathione ABC transporter ATP-binding protein [Bifidobacterium ramosum]|uniref:Dipeptide ABC transporter ATP-binding protein n=1 Tax=Bifidobacterium ramosum TaxID=1798158 RepID=A0A6L4WZI1_9BIFI|nr:ABC transporter ATP-binding protein [Bifidobacterium ramosum]KAB8287766.1 glutathione ABC transporter ATP-binding protein [Bifidobacterium ramosum]NEG71286.1 dipeptide ABC transporter ATP-binding protein [Bifidobacterium ramosum]